MDYIDQLKQFSARAKQIAPSIATEEATKTALILPFFQMLGYDVFNPVEFVPEFTADVGIKKGEKVDYAIVLNGDPTILIEAKWCGEKLDNHDSQLFRYFGTTTAKLAILTNGIVYRFYTDLDEPNKMDLTPFMEFDVLNIRENLVSELKRFNKSTLNVENIFSAASDLKYTSAVKALLAKQAEDPEDDFLSYIIREVYPGRKTAQVAEKFKEIVKKSFSQYVTELMNLKFKSVLEPSKEPVSENEVADDETDDTQSDAPSIVTTDTEMEAYVIIRTLLREKVDPARVMHKDTASYFGILLDGKTTKWICRLFLDGKKKKIVLANGEKYALESNDSLYSLQNALEESLEKVL